MYCSDYSCMIYRHKNEISKKHIEMDARDNSLQKRYKFNIIEIFSYFWRY